MLIATVHSQQSFDLEFWDCEFEGEKQKPETKNKEVVANLMLMGASEHYGVTDVEWDPTGRYVATSVSMWSTPYVSLQHSVSLQILITGYRWKTAIISGTSRELFSAKSTLTASSSSSGVPARNNALQGGAKTIRKNLRDYSRQFDEEDTFEAETANREVVEARKRQLDEWRAWRERVEKDLKAQRVELGLPEDPNAAQRKKDEAEDTVIEEIVEEVISEHEEEIV